jgi:hypothetical protein
VDACETSRHGQWLPTTSSEWRGKLPRPATRPPAAAAAAAAARTKLHAPPHDSAAMDYGGTGSPSECWLLSRMWSDGRRELLLGMVILLLLSSGKTSKTSTAGDKAQTTRLEESSRSLRWGQGCSYHYLSSLLFRPCRCIKPNAQASRDPPPIRCPISKQHTAPATEHSTTCNLHWPNTALYQTATSWRQLLTAVKSRALASFRPCLLCKSRCCLAKCPSPPKVARLDFDARIP